MAAETPKAAKKKAQTFSRTPMALIETGSIITKSASGTIRKKEARGIGTCRARARKYALSTTRAWRSSDQPKARARMLAGQRRANRVSTIRGSTKTRMAIRARTAAPPKTQA